MFLPAICNFFLWDKLPDFVPTRISITGNVSKYANKYSVWVLPMLSILSGSLYLIIGKLANLQEKYGNNNEKYSYIFALVPLSILNIINFYLILLYFDKSLIHFSIYNLVFGSLAVGMILEGNYLPKTKVNNWIGIRLFGNIKNDDAWKTSQKFGGITLIISGILILLGSLFILNNKFLIIYTCIVTLSNLSIIILYTYKITK